MNVSLIIAKRIAFNKQPSFSRFIIRLSVAATALSVAAMIITVSFVNGFQTTVSNKVFSFWGHIRVQHFDLGKSLIAEETPIAKNDTVLKILQHQKGVTQIQAFATKSAVIEKNKEIEGILFKGLEATYSTTQLSRFLIKGRLINFLDSTYAKEILLAEPIAKSLNVTVNDTINIYFIQSKNGEQSSRRKLRIAGIYRTGIEDFDKLFAIGDIRLIQRMNNWDNNQIGGYEIFVNNYQQIDSINNQLLPQLPTEWASRNIKEVLPNIFDWLNIQDMNRNIIFVIMAFVAVINLITCLLVLVLERTRMIGILKALGSTNNSIQQIFLYYATVITIAGVGIGLLLGVGVCILQQTTHFITLDESSYYVAYAPVDLVGWEVLIICVTTAIICIFSLFIPTLLIRKMAIVKAIQFK